MVRRQAGGVPQPWFASGQSECSRPASRVEQIVPASRGDGAPPGLRNVAAEFEEADARADALSGNCQTVRRLGRPALALAMCGDAAQAEKLAAETSKLFPNGTIWNAVQLPGIRAAIALQRDQPARAWNCWHPPRPTSALTPRRFTCAAWLTCVCIRARRQRPSSGRLWITRAPVGASTWRHPNWGQYYSISYLGLARGWALAGDTARARKAFEDFFALWKDADPDSRSSSKPRRNTPSCNKLTLLLTFYINKLTFI